MLPANLGSEVFWMVRPTRPVPTRILLVSPLPPPMGGVQTWTETLLRRGLPDPFAVDLVNTRQTGQRRKKPGPRLTWGEAVRFFRILWRFYSSLRSVPYALVHLNSSFSGTATLMNLCTMWIARQAGVPYVVHLRGTFRVPAGPVQRLDFIEVRIAAYSTVLLGYCSWANQPTFGSYAW